LILAVYLSKIYNVEILGITITSGNTSLSQTLKNTQLILKLCNREDIPIYKEGVEEKPHNDFFFDVDGLGGVYAEYNNKL
jgi:inosine-uridine nucleoside N-ribohydrolase